MDFKFFTKNRILLYCCIVFTVVFFMLHFPHVEFFCYIYSMWNFHVIVSAFGISVLYFLFVELFYCIFMLYFCVKSFVLYFRLWNLVFYFCIIFLCCIFHVWDFYVVFSARGIFTSSFSCCIFSCCIKRISLDVTDYSDICLAEFLSYSRE